MLINPSNLDFIFKSVSKAFEMAYYSEPQPIVEGVAMRVPSGTRDGAYPFTQVLSGAMQEWIGERKSQNIVLQDFQVVNKLWENSLTIPRVSIEDDQFGLYASMLAPNLARHARMLPDVEVAKVFNENYACFDGEDLFSASHPTDPSGQTSGTQSNVKTSRALSSTSLALTQADMMSFLGPDGLPMGCYGNVLFVPPSLKYTADTLANATFYPESKNGTSDAVYGAQSNVFQGQYKVIASPYLTDTGNPSTAVWYLLDCRTEMRAALWQDRTTPELVSLVDPSNPYTYFQDKFAMGCRMRGAASAGLWFKAIKCGP